ncbi:RNA polymerase sigma factor SigJ [Nocardioides sp. KR10-350]|uniref:RNA polymerase sigma factor SigJ n=1 Tax=Nocardioides cheoyonin TaxID=3156615 RepID=UPI0032B5A4CB
MTRAAEFEELRPLLFSIAYRILSSVTDAEDAVQEAWLRYAAVATEPRSPKAYLSTVVTRISIDVLRSARVRRETYVGPWFPEPLPTDSPTGLLSAGVDGDPERAAELADSVSMAALLLLERLSPLERAVFVLREVFGFGFDEVAAAVGRSQAACRQLASRARRHMDTGQPRFEADRRKRAELADRFFDAVRDGDLDALQTLLAADVETVNDGGGTAGGQGGSFGAVKAARILVAAIPPLLATGARFERRELNGQPGAILRDRDGNVLGTWTLEILDGQIQRIRSVTSPVKLRHLGPVADLHSVVRERSRARRVQRPTRPGTTPDSTGHNA